MDSWHGKPWSTAMRPRRRTTAMAWQPTLATPKRCKDAKELKVAEYEHQFKTIDDLDGTKRF